MEIQKAARSKYNTHRHTAKQRGINFLLTFDEWWALWEPHWHNRGQASHQMCMCRTRDDGPYAVGNVRIATNKENRQEAAVSKLVKRTSRGRTYRPREARVTITNAQNWMNRGDVNKIYEENAEMLDTY
jgi:hypothetical protein